MSESESKIPPAVLRTWRKLRGDGTGPSKLWLVSGAVMLLIVVRQSCTSIEAGEVAVRVNNATGSMDVITQPGLVAQLPFGLNSVYTLDVTPQTFHLRGTTNKSVLERRELEVRASDGSNFAFNDTTIIFRAIPGKADETLRDAGLGHGYYTWLVPYSRAILRDEFGRESTLGVSNPTTFHIAEERAKTRLNKLIGEHGVEVTSIVTPRPRFTKSYEDLIEARNQAENQLAVIDSELQRAKTERDRKLAEVDRDGNKVIQTKRAELESALAASVTQQTQTHREVDSYKIDKLASGEASRSAAKSKSDQLKGELDAHYEAKRAQIDAFRNQPVERVMERLGERLKGITIDIQPYQHDGAPKRIQLENVGGAK
jgi:SPFH domain/Band 7 family protein